MLVVKRYYMIGTQVEIRDLLKELKGLRTRILYDRPIIANLFMFQYIIPEFSKEKIYVVIYSDAFYHNFCKAGEYAMLIDPDMAKLLEKLNIVKIGYSKEITFGNLHAFIEHGTPKEELTDVIKALEDLSKNDVIILHPSVSYIMSSLNVENIIKFILDFYSKIPKRVTVFGFKYLKTLSVIDYFINDLYDVLITIKKDESAFDYTTYVFESECQLGGAVYKTGRLRIEGGKLVQI